MQIDPTIAKTILLGGGFYGPRPGSNFFPLLQLGDSPHRVLGEEIETWIRDGLITAAPASGEISILKGGSTEDYGEVPDIELTHEYSLTELGRKFFGNESQQPPRQN